MNIIQATDHALHKVALLFDEYRQFYRQPSDVEGATRFLKERIDRKESTIFLAFTPEGDAMGFVQLYPIFTSVGMQKAFLLNDLYVKSEYRKKGVGSALLQKSKEYGNSVGAAWILLQTEDKNLNAQKLYEKVGYVKTTDFFYFLET